MVYENKVENYIIQYTNGIISKFVMRMKYNKLNGSWELNGLWEELTFDGNLLKRRYYKADKPVGLWVAFDRKGNLPNETFFDKTPIISRQYMHKRIFKTKKDNIQVYIRYENSNTKGNYKLIKKEKKIMSKDEYLLLSQGRKKEQ